MIISAAYANTERIKVEKIPFRIPAAANAYGNDKMPPPSTELIT
eukprot:CAMPEP_0206189528 /NCGR_PEP_ID=MMETSP0166-20121206/4219_1 /ASSEMBLY_ACC=CAM_ASM_000260 /TAXON_ID=95228 /ORGANISM="Vannella robusta, Strain DIVA3 518/3/11/1/6" /LENGTH=43 /DNA_ID= /DNA_START= /DNA_END= /DNA_ORIENTATION=